MTAVPRDRLRTALSLLRTITPAQMITVLRRRRGTFQTAALVAIALVGATTMAIAAAQPAPAEPAWKTPPVTASPAPMAAPEETVPPPQPAPADLPVIDYGPAPGGFPADPEPLSTTHLTQAVHPTTTVPAYDAPGGQPLAFIAPTISGVPLTMPIVATKADWVAVILPSANRTIAWLAPQGWSLVALRDQLVVRRSSYQLTWYRDGLPQQTWPVTLGYPKTPTPLGRTFVLGRSTLPGTVYGGVDVLALGSVPDNVDALPPGLRGAHIGIHTWYNDQTLGMAASDGCIRLTKSGQRLLLAEIIPGSSVVVID